MYFFPTVRSLFQTVRLLNLGIEVQLSYFRYRKCLFMASKLLFASIYCPPICLFQTVRLLNLGIEVQLCYFRHRKYLFMVSKLLFASIYCPPVCLFQTVCLLLFENFPASTFIPDRMFIPVLRVPLLALVRILPTNPKC